MAHLWLCLLGGLSSDPTHAAERPPRGLETAPDTGTAGAMLVVGTGSANESPARSGLAHLAEHLVFQSRASASVRTRFALMNELSGGAANGMTSWDVTAIPELANQPRHLTNTSLEALNEMADRCREGAVISLLGHEPTIASSLVAAGLE